MQLHFWRNIRRFWPIGILLIVELLIAATNYIPGTYLMGWDNVMPEFNFKQAFITNIFGAWQEHRGLGLADGMGHAANLVHTIFLWILSLALPQDTLRYTFHFFMHFLGMAGMYVLTGSFLGALFYGLNLITIQMFYTPLEAFSVHFAALPWLAYSLTKYLSQPSRNSLLLFVTISFLATPQYFIPTLLLPTAILLAGISLTNIKLAIKPMLFFLIVNAFWLAPWLVNLPRNAPIIASAKINQMSSDEVYARNQVFGDLSHVFTMQGFMLDFEDVNAKGQPVFVMETWRKFIQDPWIMTISWIFVGIAGIGLLTYFLKPKSVMSITAVAVITFIISFIILANNTPVLSDVMGVLRNRIPMFAEAYRFPFTKFSLLFGFSFSILFAIGLSRIFSFARPGLAKLAFILLMLLVLLPATPVFEGRFFYDAMRVSLPRDYIKLFAFMQQQDPNGRTAYLPQPSYWSWKRYRFGLIGSGFVWYGIPQPLLDRAFDPWSNTNENYYWELSRAIYSKDVQAVTSVLEKYDVQNIILDEYLLSPSNDRSLFIDELHNMLGFMPQYQIARILGSITVYTKQTKAQTVKLETNLPIITPYTWTDNDVAYQQTGNYIAGSGDITYPFRSLFTKRSINEREFNTTDILQKITAHVFEASASSVLIPQAVKPCGLLKTGTIHAEIINNALELSSRDQRACLSFGIPDISHRDGYLVSVESRHAAGRQLSLSIINNTAKHVEMETFLSSKTGWQTDYFILPPLAPDGLGYTVYISNDSIGQKETLNDIKTINFYTIPYQEMVNMRINNTGIASPAERDRNDPTSSFDKLRTTRGTAPLHISHPNPAYYHVTLDQPVRKNQTLILSQSYDPGWIALSNGKLLKHVMVNNWKNGWTIKPSDVSHQTSDIIIFFWPQVLEYIGLGILAISFLILLKYKR